jgi:hypothetical protein
MPLKDQFGQKLARDVPLCTVTIELFKGLKLMDTPGNLVDSPTHRYGKSFFEYEYLREIEAKVGTPRNVV